MIIRTRRGMKLRLTMASLLALTLLLSGCTAGDWTDPVVLDTLASSTFTSTTGTFTTLNTPTGRVRSYVIATSQSPIIWQRQADLVLFGSGNFDVASSIQTALNNNSEVFLAPDTYYYVSVNITIPIGRTLESTTGVVGQQTVGQTAIIKALSDNISIVQCIGTSTNRTSHQTIRNIGFDGNLHSNVNGVQLVYADEVLIDCVVMAGSTTSLNVTNSRRLTVAYPVFAGNYNDVYLSYSPDAHFNGILARDETGGDAFTYFGSKTGEDGGLTVEGLLSISGTGYIMKLQGVLSAQLMQIKGDTVAKGFYCVNSTFIQFDQGFLGTVTGSGQPGYTIGVNGLPVTNSAFSELVSVSAQGDGFYTVGGDNTFTGLTGFGNGRDGFRLGGSTSRLAIVSSTFINNGKVVAGSGVTMGSEGANYDISLIGNHCNDTQGGGSKTQQYGVISGNYSTLNNIFGNDLTSNAVAGFLYSGTDFNNNINGNQGYVTEKSGTATILAGTGSISVAHGLTTTPTRVVVTASSNPGVLTGYYTGTFTTTNFTIYASVNVTNNTTLDWYAIYHPGN